MRIHLIFIHEHKTLDDDVIIVNLFSRKIMRFPRKKGNCGAPHPTFFTSVPVFNRFLIFVSGFQLKGTSELEVKFGEEGNENVFQGFLEVIFVVLNFGLPFWVDNLGLVVRKIYIMRLFQYTEQVKIRQLRNM